MLSPFLGAVSINYNMRAGSNKVVLYQGLLVLTKSWHRVPRRAADSWPRAGAPALINNILHRGSELSRRMYPTDGDPTYGDPTDGVNINALSLGL